MKIGYIGSSLYRHTFEINEVVELLRQHPGTRVYSFYRRSDTESQSRVREIGSDIITWSAWRIIFGLLYLLFRHPKRLFSAGFRLGFLSLPNPYYWVKNTATFFIALPFIGDACRNHVTHLHANFGSSPATIAWLGKQILGTGMSITFHAFDIYSKTLSLRDPLKKRKLTDADLVVAVHEHGLDQLKKLVPEVDSEKFRMIHISVVFDPRPKPDPLPQPPLFVAAGNLVPKKGFDVLVRAAGRLRREGKTVRLRILGEGPERITLETLVRVQEMRELIELPGYYQHGELAHHLSQATGFVVPSKVVEGGQRDGIPTVLVEAWLSQTPVVASLVGGMGEVLADGETGLVFPSDDHAALAKCLLRLIESDALRSTLVERGLHAAKTQFSPEVNVRALVDAISDVSRSRQEEDHVA
ncbi:MAG: glycosyltransferase family 4 protein [Candidatus Latescibacterota bacterium]|nr:MAG: glycosyltransferase family 4 protein [Candidatus Latescibacterota bacterium]